MTRIVKFTDSLGGQLSERPLEMLDSFREITDIDGIRKMERVFIDGRIDHTLYYASDEDVIDDVIRDYAEEEVHVFHDSEILNAYLKRRVNMYRRGILVTKSIIVDNSEGEIVFESNLDIKTESHLESKKYVYNSELDEDGEREIQYNFTYKWEY